MKLNKKILIGSMGVLTATASFLKAVNDLGLIDPIKIIHPILKEWRPKMYILDVRAVSMKVKDEPIFEEVFLSTTDEIDVRKRNSFKHCDKINIDFFFHGSDGIHKRKMRDAYTKDDTCIVTVSPYYNNKGDGDNSTWRYIKLRELDIDTQKKAIIDLFKFIFDFLISQSQKPIGSVSFYGHSQGGVMQALMARHFTDGWLRLCEEKKFEILGYFDADSHYFENWNFWQVYFLSHFKLMQEYGTDDLQSRESLIAHTFNAYQIACDEARRFNSNWRNRRGCGEWANNHFKEISDRVKGLTHFRVPKYFGTAKGWHWLHQTGLHIFAIKNARDFCKDDTIRYYYWEKQGLHDCGNQHWDEVMSSSKGRYDQMHGNAWWFFVREARVFLNSAP